MNKRQTLTVLYFYKDIEHELEENREAIMNLEEEYYTTLSGTNYDGMPKIQSGNGLCKTESAALNISDNEYKLLNDLRKKRAQIYKLKSEIEKELNKLPYASRTVINSFYILSHKWKRISEQISYSERQCKNIRDRSIKQLSNFFEKNEVIKKYNYPSYFLE